MIFHFSYHNSLSKNPPLFVWALRCLDWSRKTDHLDKNVDKFFSLILKPWVPILSFLSKKHLTCYFVAFNVVMFGKDTS